MSKKGIAGGKSNAIISHQKSLDKYYSSPNICLNCGAIITVPIDKNVHAIKRNKFCNHSCAATYNNKLHPKINSTKVSSGLCLNCGNTILFKQRPNKQGYYRRKYCDLCVKYIRIKSRNDNILWECTKSELFKNSLNWQSARSSIQRDARKRYIQSGNILHCAICGYSIHTDIAHIKSVNSFPDDTLISVINDPKNLIALCPNHHWEFDHNILKLSQINSQSNQYH